MNKILLKYFPDTTSKLAFLLALFPTCSIIGFLHFPPVLYYLCLFVLWLYGIFRRTIVINPVMLLVILSAILSILWGNPPSFFLSWERLGLFIFSTAILSPLVQTYSLMKIRSIAFKWLLYFSVAIAVLSFPCYFIGINYMVSTIRSISNDATGWFGGLTINSMLLGPISSIASSYLLWIYLKYKTSLKTLQKFFLLLALFASICSLLLTASRGSFIAMLVGLFSVLYLFYRHNISGFLRTILTILLLLLICFPIYQPYTKGLVEKQEANITTGGTFSSRVDKWDNRIAEFKQSPLFGVGFASVDPKNTKDYDGKSIEPGSSWLAIFSMTGMLGGCTIVCLLLYYYYYLYQLSEDFNYSLYLALLNVFIVHMMTEGYIFSAGNYLFFYFWLLIGTISSLKIRDNEKEL